MPHQTPPGFFDPGVPSQIRIEFEATEIQKHVLCFCAPGRKKAAYISTIHENEVRLQWPEST
jgi:hypothetical protein